MKRFASFLTALALLISVGMPISTAFASVPVEWANGTAPEAATTSSDTTDTSTDSSTASTTTTTPVCTSTTEEYVPQTASGVPVEWGSSAPTTSVITTTVCTNPDGSVTTTVESPRGTTTSTTQPTASTDTDSTGESESTTPDEDLSEDPQTLEAELDALQDAMDEESEEVDQVVTDEVIDFVVEGDESSADDLITSIENDFFMLENLSQEEAEVALQDGDFDRLAKKVEFLKSKRRNLTAEQKRKYKEIRKRSRGLTKTFRSLRGDIRKAERRVRRSLRKFKRELRKADRSLRNASDFERTEIADELKGKLLDVSTDLLEQRKKAFRRKTMEFRQWCMDNPDDCREEIKNRNENRDNNREMRRANARSKCNQSDNPERCKQDLSAIFYEVDQIRQTRIDLVKDLRKLCVAGGDKEECKDVAQDVRDHVASQALLRQQAREERERQRLLEAGVTE